MLQGSLNCDAQGVKIGKSHEKCNRCSKTFTSGNLLNKNVYLVDISTGWSINKSVKTKFSAHSTTFSQSSTVLSDELDLSKSSNSSTSSSDRHEGLYGDRIY